MVNCAAWTAVDAAEEHEDEALAINGHGAANLAAACAEARRAARPPVHRLRLRRRRVRAVRRGRADRARAAPTAAPSWPASWRSAPPCPTRSYLVRTAWLYGAHGKNFVKTMLRLARNGTAPGVVADQHGQPTWTADVAAQICALIDASAPAGVYHATSSGQTTWFGFAEEIFRLYNEDPNTMTRSRTGNVRTSWLTPRPIATADYPTPAQRPAYTVLGHDAWHKAGIEPIGDWKDALHRAFTAILAGLAATAGKRGSASWRCPGRTLPA